MYGDLVMDSVPEKVNVHMNNLKIEGFDLLHFSFSDLYSLFFKWQIPTKIHGPFTPIM